MNAQPEKKSLLPLIVLNLALLGILTGVITAVFWPASTLSSSALQNAKTIPAFGMQSALHERAFGSADLKGDIFALNIFASWCKPCEAEHPFLIELSQQYGLPLYGVALKDDPDKLAAFLQRLGNPYRDIGYDNAGLLPSGLGVAGVPTTIIANSDLEILYIHEGPITRSVIDNQILPLF